MYNIQSKKQSVQYKDMPIQNIIPIYIQLYLKEEKQNVFSQNIVRIYK